MMKAKILTCMVIIIYLPVWFMVVPLTKIIPPLAVDENRNLKEWPTEISTIFTGDGEYFREIESYYNDNFGTRDLFIRIKNQINYSLFNYTPLLYIDKEKNEYYYSVVATQQPEKERLTDEERYQTVNHYKEISEFCNNRGVEFALIMPPQKNTTYETMGLPVLRPTPHSYTRMEQMLQEELPNNYIETLKPLQKANKIAPVFYKTDFHWNDYGAAIAFGEVVNHFAKRQEIKAPFNGEFEFIEMPEFKGGQDKDLSILFSLTETAITIKAKTPITSILEPNPIAPFWMHWKNSAKAPLEGAAVFIGDSFTPPVIYAFNNTNSGIMDYFSEVFYVNWSDSEGILNNLPDNTKYLIIERIEVGFDKNSSIEALLNSK